MAGTYEDRYIKSENATRYIKQKVSDISPTLDSDDDSSPKKKVVLKPALLTSILAGGFAGVVVDFGLFPLDTIKTRLQSEVGFRAAGGFRGIYKGIIPVLLSSAPLSALFFATYNTVVNTIKTENNKLNPLVYFVGATAAEVLCASARVPLEVLKQRQQASQQSAFHVLRKTYISEGLPGFYRGFWSTLIREIPFAAIQYPLWEYMINEFIIYQNGKELTALQTAYCGAAAGGIAAALTTPMDVIKTRVMLAEKEKVDLYKSSPTYNFAKEVYRDRGFAGFFAGVIPRVLWITLGGFLYFGAYDKARVVCEKDWCEIMKRETRRQESAPTYIEDKLENVPFFVSIMCRLQSRMKSVFGIDLKQDSQTDAAILSATGTPAKVTKYETPTNTTPDGTIIVTSSTDTTHEHSSSNVEIDDNTSKEIVPPSTHTAHENSPSNIQLKGTSEKIVPPFIPENSSSVEISSKNREFDDER